jgi:transcriptional regulator GlxA family with amidase domain
MSEPTPAQTVERLRVDAAYSLLRSPGGRVSDIAF